MAVQITEKPDKDVMENKLEFMKFMSGVHHSLKEHIGADFIFAKLGEKDREYITETTHNAFYGVKLIMGVLPHCGKWEWIKEEEMWRKRPYTKEEQEVIINYSIGMFQSFMVRVFMTVTTNINVKDNYHVRLMAGAGELVEEEQQAVKKDKGFFKSFIDRIKGEPE